MKRNRIAKHINAASQHELSTKPYGFCCDVNEKSARLREEFYPLFPASHGEGPDVKFRIQEDDPNSGGGQRIRGKYRGSQINRGDERGRRRWNQGDDGRLTRMIRSAGERMICKRSRGPMQFYVEQEIASALEIVMNARREKRDAEAERNVRIVKEKEKKKRRKGKKSTKQEEKAANEDNVIENEAKFVT